MKPASNKPIWVTLLRVVVLGFAIPTVNADPPRRRSKAKERLVEALVVGSTEPTQVFPKPKLRDLEIIGGDTFDTKPLLDMITLRIPALNERLARLEDARPT